MERNHPSPPPPSATQSSAEFNSSLESAARRAEVFRKLVEAEVCRKLVEEIESGRLDETSLSLRLQEVGASPKEAKNYLEQLRGNSGQRQNRARPENQTQPVASADSIVRAQLRQKLDEISRGPRGGSVEPPFSLMDLGRILDLTKPSVGIPSDVLIEAPLQEYLKTTQGESRLERTWKLLQWSPNSTSWVNRKTASLMQRQPMPDSLRRSIWEDLILHKCFEFETLYAGMERDYDHAFVKKDHFRARKPVQTEWIPINLWEFEDAGKDLNF